MIVEDRSGISYRVDLSQSGLLVEIATLEGGLQVDMVQIGEKAWPSIVQAVADVMTQRRVQAEAGNAVHRALHGDDD